MIEDESRELEEEIGTVEETGKGRETTSSGQVTDGTEHAGRETVTDEDDGGQDVFVIVEGLVKQGGSR